MLKEIYHRRWFIPGLIVILLFLLLIFYYSDESAKIPPTWVAVNRGDLSIDAVETGEVRAVHSVDIKAPMEWRMELQIIDMAPEGAIVNAGDFLAQFDTSELLKRLEIAKDRLASSMAQRDRLLAEQSARLSQLRSDVKSASYSQDSAVLQKELLKYEAEMKRQDAELEEKKAEIQHQEAETNLESQSVIDASALSALKVEIGKARMEVNELERKIASLRLTAPIGGMVVYNEVGWWNNQKKASKGDKVRPGESIVSIPNLQEMQINLRVNEMDVARLELNQEAKIFLDAYPEKVFSGKIIQIAKLAQKENWESLIKDFEIIVKIDQTDDVLKPGMTAKVQVACGKLMNTLYVPIGTVYESDGKPVIFPQNRYPRPVEVEIGARTDHWIAIKNKELKEKELIAWRTPERKYQRLGYTESMAKIKNAGDFLSQAFAEMDGRGLGYDYDGNRDKRVIAQAGEGGLPPDAEKVRAQFQTMSQGGKPVEIDGKMMKQLQQTLRGMQPGMSQPLQERSGKRIPVRSNGPEQPGMQRIIIESPQSGQNVIPKDSTKRTIRK